MNLAKAGVVLGTFAPVMAIALAGLARISASITYALAEVPAIAKSAEARAPSSVQRDSSKQETVKG
jgi:hypothetical protein